MDGTFFTVPRLFMQLFSIFVIVSDYCFPAVFVIMTRRTCDLYKLVFDRIKELVPLFVPTLVMADYESASVAAFRSVWGLSIECKGCWFHYAQAILKKTRKLGLTSAYTTQDSIVRKCVSLIVALPLLPSDAILEAFNDIVTNVVSTIPPPHDQATNELVLYTRRQWISKPSVGPDRLSVSGLSFRTNNGMESFHAKLKRSIKIPHPSVNAFFPHLRDIAVDCMLDALRIQQGVEIRRGKKKQYIANEKRIKKSLQRYNAGQVNSMQFLSAVSHCADTLGRMQQSDVIDSDSHEEAMDENQSLPASLNLQTPSPA